MKRFLLILLVWALTLFCILFLGYFVKYGNISESLWKVFELMIPAVAGFTVGYIVKDL